MLENSIKEDTDQVRFWEPIPHPLDQKSIKKVNEHKYKFQILEYALLTIRKIKISLSFHQFHFDTLPIPLRNRYSINRR